MFGAIGGSKMPQKYPYKIHLSRGTFYTALFPAVSNDAYSSYLLPVDWYWYQKSDTGTRALVQNSMKIKLLQRQRIIKVHEWCSLKGR